MEFPIQINRCIATAVVTLPLITSVRAAVIRSHDFPQIDLLLNQKPVGLLNLAESFLFLLLQQVNPITSAADCCRHENILIVCGKIMIWRKH